MSLGDSLHAAFHEPQTPAYRLVESFVWLLVLVSIGLLALEPFVPDGSRAADLLARTDDVVLSLFAIELVLRIASYRPPALAVFDVPPLGRLRTAILTRLRFMLTPMMLIDIVTVLALVPALRGLRVLRLLRLLRTAPLFRYANPFQGLIRAFENDRLLFVFAFAVLGTETILGGLSLFLIERTQNPEISSVADSMWWALVTITTVGFGDITPITSLGRVVGGGMMIGGMFTLALFAGIVGHSLLNAVLSIREEQFRMSGYVNHIVVCGYEHGTDMLLEALREELNIDEQRVVLFSPGDRPPSLDPNFLWVRGDPTKESELDKVRLTHASTTILAASRVVSPQQADAQTILTGFTIRAYLGRQTSSRLRKRPVHVVAEILESENVQHARSAGIDEVIETYKVGYSLLAHAVVYPGVADATSRLVFPGTQNLYVGRIPQELALPMSFDELSHEIRELTDVLVIGIRNPQTGEEQLNPPKKQLIEPDMHVLYFAAEPRLETP